MGMAMEIAEQPEQFTAESIQEPVDATSPEYVNGVLQPGCLVCAARIPENSAKMRSKVCNAVCRNELRRLRQTPGLLVKVPLYCQVCRAVIPAATAKKLGVVCGKECRNELRRYRFMVLKKQKCPHCYHPAGAEEWELYRQFRVWLGKQRGGGIQEFLKPAGRGNLTAKREKFMRESLEACSDVIQKELNIVLRSYATEFMEGEPVRSSLNPDGEAAAVPLEKSLCMAKEAIGLFRNRDLRVSI